MTLLEAAQAVYAAGERLRDACCAAGHANGIIAANLVKAIAPALAVVTAAMARLPGADSPCGEVALCGRSSAHPEPALSARLRFQAMLYHVSALRWPENAFLGPQRGTYVRVRVVGLMVTRPSTLESDRSELLDLVDRRKPLTPPSPAEQRARQKLVAMLKAKAKHGAECRISDETIAQQRQLVANFASAPSPTQGSAPEPRAQSASERAARRDLARMEEIASRYGERSRFSPEQIERQRELVERLARGWDAPITWLREPVRIPGCTTYVHGYTAGLKLPDWLSILLAEPSGRAA